MAYFSNQRSNRWIIIILVLLNSLSLAALWWGGPKHSRRHGPPHKHAERFLVKELSLDEQQKQDLRRILKGHMEQHRSFDKDIRSKNRQLVEAITASTMDTAKVNAITASIAEQHKQISVLLITYYNQLKQICRPDQQELLQSVFQEMLEKNRPPRRPPHKDK